MKTPFLGGAYQLRSLPLSAQTLVNLYAEKNESGDGEIGAFYGTPGLITQAQLAIGEVRAARAVGVYLFAVSGNQVYRLDSTFAATNIGTLPNASGPISMTDNGVQVLFAHADGWHYCTLTGLLQPVETVIENITAATAANPVSFTTAADHGWVTGDEVDFEGLPGDYGTNLNGTTQEITVTGSNTFTVEIDTTAYTGTFPAGTAERDANAPLDSIVTYQDGYVLFTTGDDEFGLTGLNDVTSISPLDIATAEGAPDPLVNIFCHDREAWLFGLFSLEIWDDTGAALFPFERIPGGMLEIGCGARFSVARIDDSLWWLSQDKAGNATIVRTNAYRPVRVSTHALENALESYSRVDDAIAWGYQQEGHAFYVITFPTADATWVYDCATQLWGQRSWRDSNGVQHRIRANCYAFFNNMHILGDFNNGKLYQWDLDTFTDAGDVIYRERAWPISEQEHKRIRIDRLELVAETGVGNSSGLNMDPQVWFQISRDGGQTFGYSWYQSLGAIGARLARAVWRRIGLSRRPVGKLATTCTNKVVWIAVNVDGEVMSQ